MQRLIIEIDSPEKARELQSMLLDLRSVNSVTMISDLPQEQFESEDAFYAEMDQRVKDLESGEDKGLSIEELVAETRKMRRKRA